MIVSSKELSLNRMGCLIAIKICSQNVVQLLAGPFASGCLFVSTTSFLVLLDCVYLCACSTDQAFDDLSMCQPNDSGFS